MNVETGKVERLDSRPAFEAVPDLCGVFVVETRNLSTHEQPLLEHQTRDEPSY